VSETTRGWSVTDMATGPYLRSSSPLGHPETIAAATEKPLTGTHQVQDEEILG